MNGWEWLVIMILMAVFGLLGQWLENRKREEARKEAQRRARPQAQPVSVEEYLKELLRTEEPPRAEPARRDQPPAGRPVTPRRAPRQGRTAPRKAARRAPSKPAQASPVAKEEIFEKATSVRVEIGELLQGFDAGRRQDVTTVGVAEFTTDLSDVAPRTAVHRTDIARRVHALLRHGDARDLASAIVLLEVLRPPVCVRRSPLRPGQFSPVPSLPPPAAAGWL